MRLAALVLAGGRATRLGGVDKPLLPLGPHTILDEILTRLRRQVDDIAISANADPTRFALPVLPDEFVNRGPLAGVLRGLEWARGRGADTLLTIPGDTPFLPHDLAKRLAPGPSHAASASGAHYLTALWPVTAAAALRARLTQGGDTSVRAFATSLRARAILFDDEIAFLNVNTPEDLAEARKHA